MPRPRRRSAPGRPGGGRSGRRSSRRAPVLKVAPRLAARPKEPMARLRNPVFRVRSAAVSGIITPMTAALTPSRTSIPISGTTPGSVASNRPRRGIAAKPTNSTGPPPPTLGSPPEPGPEQHDHGLQRDDGPGRCQPRILMTRGQRIESDGQHRRVREGEQGHADREGVQVQIEEGLPCPRGALHGRRASRVVDRGGHGPRPQSQQGAERRPSHRCPEDSTPPGGGTVDRQ